MRKHARIDSNHIEIVETFRQMGFSVVSLAAIGSGCPDLLIARGGKCGLVEVKDGAKAASAQRLTGDQVKFHAVWKSRISIVRDRLDAISLGETWQ